eukprot:CAMPEP_0117659250 /NCGR_PEP_ID=MMETSP0804-20121206/6324_1 /TAXON_ID=1074897 /ORGANISM="Tetraselmis astigmatica, Strain CCMP880" /LENGTH=434 /DNA_ID=CAMNT_0005465879 /DNA_START=255 /DNA_END=1559 /DNA_ORIENTATION=+
MARLQRYILIGAVLIVGLRLWSLSFHLAPPVDPTPGYGALPEASRGQHHHSNAKAGDPGGRNRQRGGSGRPVKLKPAALPVRHWEERENQEAGQPEAGEAAGVVMEAIEAEEDFGGQEDLAASVGGSGDGGGVTAAQLEGESGGYPHADTVTWLSHRMQWLHLLKKPGVDVAPVMIAADNVANGRTKYTEWMSMKQKTLSLEGPFVGSQLPPTDYGAGGQRLHKTCALVGNSGILLGSGLGRAIDTHDAVMRINYPPVSRWEKDVGSKVTYDFSNRENARRILNAKNTLLEPPNRKKPTTLIFFEVSSPVNRRSLFGPLIEKINQGRLKTQVHFLHPDFVFRSMRLWNELQREIEAQQHRKFKPKPMSGWLAMMFMTQMCEQLDVYGFEGYNNPHAGHPYHYFDKVKAVLKHHSFDFAIEAYRLLGKLHPITMH